MMAAEVDGIIGAMTFENQKLMMKTVLLDYSGFLANVCPKDLPQ